MEVPVRTMECGWPSELGVWIQPPSQHPGEVWGQGEEAHSLQAKGGAELLCQHEGA